jgi:SpoIID/LytB domain protein
LPAGALAGVPSSILHSSDPSETVYIDGLGGAHGYGLAMDGVEGEADHGWNHDKILSLFYAGTNPAHFAGTIRVWLAEGGAQTVTLPAGGAVLNGANGPRLATILPGGHVTVSEANGSLRIAATGTPPPPKPANDYAASSPPPNPVFTPNPTEPPAPTPLATLVPTARPIRRQKPTPSPAKTTAPTPASTPSLQTKNSVFIVPAGDPALTTVNTTGHSYRGTIELRRAASGSVRVINHVDLETYVDGIAEEKGAGWPPEAMDVLAIAARSLAASTMTWYTTHHGEGYDICNSDKCQVYLGYDGEDASMRAAQAATAGVIRTYNGSAILAMYHGNGGGQTETYGPDYPYLKSVKYPYADPYHWHVETSFAKIEDQLRAANHAVPDPLELLRVLKRGDSPRVESLELGGGHDATETMNGTDFASALNLPSTWFFFSTKKPAASVKVSTATLNAPMMAFGSDVIRSSIPRADGPLWPLLLIVSLVTFVFVTSATFVLREPQLRVWLRTLDVRALRLRLRRHDPAS